MSDNNNLSNFLNPASSAGSANAGTWEANNGGCLSPQQSYESSSSYEQRQAAFNYAKQQNESK
jgi:hypothetical protein